MSKKLDRQNRLIALLSTADSWISAATLAQMLDTTERTIRNYIRELTPRYGIESSSLGYRLIGKPSHENSASPKDGPDSTAQTSPADSDSRARDIVVRLISSKEPMSIFDIADSLAVSESTILTKVMPKMRTILIRFNIKLVEQDFRLSLEGSETDKRRVLGYLARSNATGFFSSEQTIEAMFPDIDCKDMLAKLVKICQDSGLLLNNYALQNMLIHVLIILIRLKDHNSLEDTDEFADIPELLRHFSQKDAILRCTEAMSALFEREYGITMPNRDFREIILLVALSIDRYDCDKLDFDTAARISDKPFLDCVIAAGTDLCERYGIPAFTEEFNLQLAMHVYNAYQRAIYHVGISNPIGPQIKKSHAPVYDMAVYFAHQIEPAYGIELSEDEIAFIAFHIGAYIERTERTHDFISCSIVVEQYHDFGQQFIDAIERSFGQNLIIEGTGGIRSFLAYPTDSDLLVTTTDIPYVHPHKVLVSPLLGMRDIRIIREEIGLIKSEKLARAANDFLLRLIKPGCFVRNVDFDGPETCIRYLGSLAERCGLIDAAFIEDVMLREKVSSTSFVDGLAIPHSISLFPNASFICILHNDKPIPWGRSSANIVLLVGLAQHDMKQFRPIFDFLVDQFSSTSVMSNALKSDTLEEFLNALAG